MWGLYGWLLAKGQVAYMNRWPDGDKVAIYPEIQRGNPANASTVVRYILNTPGIMGAIYDDGRKEPGPTKFDEKDKIYVFSKIYDTFGVDYNHLLFLPIADLHVFKDQKKKRKKTCYLIGKGKNKLIHPKDSIELNRKFAMDQNALADVLNECECLYGYDPMSAMYELARLCGCRVKYFGSMEDEDIEKYEPGMNGFGLNGEDKPLYTDEFREHYINMIRSFDTKLDMLIEETQHD